MVQGDRGQVGVETSAPATMERSTGDAVDDASGVDPAPESGTGSWWSVPSWVAVCVGLLFLVGLASISEFAAESLVIGSTENAPLVLAALGFALLYRLTGLLNVAFAETITLGGYFGIWLTSTFGWGFSVAVIPAGILAGLLSVATYLLIFRVAKNRNVSGLELIVISFGLSLFLRHALQFVFGYTTRFYETSPPNTVDLFGVGVPSFRLYAVASVAILSLLIYQFIRRTSYGLQIRALASNDGLAQASGVRPLTVTLLIWFVAGFAGGLAGAFYGVGSAVTPLLGSRQLLLILLVVLVGGLWDLIGVVWVGAITGIALTAMTLEFGSDQYGKLILIVLFMGVLKLRGRRLTDGSKV